jgi:molybdopterin-guanine dinucleotide biosynthesis protein A
MLGVILCGGQSNRMGTDKGLLKVPLPSRRDQVLADETRTWAQTTIDKLSELKLSIVISVNKLQLNAYTTLFSPQQLVADNDTLKMKGPLCGVLSVHLQYPSEDLVILACDMPLMETGLIKELLNRYKEQAKYDAFVFTNDGEAEPLCGIYKSKGLAHILQLYQTNQLPKYSMKYMLGHISVHYTPLPNQKKNAFRNFNAHAELNGL